MVLSRQEGNAIEQGTILLDLQGSVEFHRMGRALPSERNNLKNIINPKRE